MRINSRRGGSTARAALRILRLLAVLAVAMALTTVARAPAAHAAFPGANGNLYGFAFASDYSSAQLYSWNADGSGFTALTSDAFINVQPVASADGKKLAFQSDRSGTPQVWIMNTDGTGLAQVTSGIGITPYRGISWSPTGQIYYVFSSQLHSINPDGTGDTALTTGFNDSYPAVSPDGSKIAFARQVASGYNNLFVINANGTGLVQLTSDDNEVTEPNWAPDGTKIVYTDGAAGNIMTMNPDGSGATVLTTAPAVGAVTDWAVVVSGPTYSFTGFFQPVDNLPTFNLMRAGAAVPVKFSLGGYQGLDIFAATYPRSQQIPFNSGELVDGVEETVSAGNSGLQYDPATDTYTYVWKTDKAWKNTCRQLVLKLADGTFHRANFQFN